MVGHYPTNQLWQYCPVERSPLLHLGYESPDSAVHGVVKYYCPICDAAFLAITVKTPGRSDAEGLVDVVEILSWKRVDGKLQMVEERPTGYFSDQQWEDREKMLRHDVQRFLDERAMTERQQLPCLFDGLDVPVIYTLEDADLNDPLTIAWCELCRTGFAYVRDLVYGWEALCTYEWEANSRQYEFLDVVRHRGASRLTTYTYRCIAKLLPPPPGKGTDSQTSAS